MKNINSPTNLVSTIAFGVIVLFSGLVSFSSDSNSIDESAVTDLTGTPSDLDIGNNDGGNVDTDPDIISTAFNSTNGVLCDYSDTTFNDSASVNTQKTSAWTCSATSRDLTANGVPDHIVGEFPNPGNPNTISEQSVSVSYTLTPEQTGVATVLGGPSGPQGYVLNGVKIDSSTAGTCDDTGESCSLIGNTGNWNIEALGQSAFDFGTDETMLTSNLMVFIIIMVCRRDLSPSRVEIAQQ